MFSGAMLSDRSNDAIPTVLLDHNSVNDTKERGEESYNNEYKSNPYKVYTNQPSTCDLSFISISSESYQTDCDYVASSRNTKCQGDEEFNECFQKAQSAILTGIYPQLIPTGSSGSYFVFDKDFTNIAVFKPKDEEPFAALNPKWPKFFQRVLCFCCFGRACLIPNNGYMSETGASIVDQMMRLNVVPKTRVVKLSSPSFFYSRCCGRVEVKPKEGSFQLFVHDYESALRVFSRWDYDKSLLSPEDDKKSFSVIITQIADT